jgi:DNA-binding MarR family transcriptional regulator
MPERVDRAVADWKRERPDLDTGPLETIGRIKIVAEKLVAGLEAYFARQGLSLADFEIIAALMRSGKPYRLTQRDLGDRVMRTPGTITSRIDRLAAAGLVERRPHPDDRRAFYVGLTRRGSQTFDRIVDGHLANEHALLAGLTPPEQRALIKLLDKLEAGMTAPVS